MYWFGKNTGENFNWQDDQLWDSLIKTRRDFAAIPVEEIINLLDAFGKMDFSDALPDLIRESGFSEEETVKTLKLLPHLLKRENLLKRVRAEFGRTEILDKFIKLPGALNKTRAVSQGIVLHVTAGNVFLSSIDSLIMGFLTKNISIVKVSSQNKFFPVYFAERLKAFDKDSLLADKFAVLYWKGGDSKPETFLKNKVNTIIAWGGEEMISAYKKNLSPRVKFLDFGPKVSLQVITKKGLENKSLTKVAESIVSDITPWNQSACASPQNLYLEDGINAELLLDSLEKAFNKAEPRGMISDDEATEVLKEKFRGYYSELMEDGILRVGKDYLLHQEKNNLVKPSPLNRSLIIKTFKGIEDLVSILEPFSYYLQSCSYLLHESERNVYLESLSLTGIKRLAPLGTITWGMEGAPHDGRFVLRELVHFIGDENRVRDFGEEAPLPLTDSTYIRKHFEATPHPQGYIFSSGGTTGEPKYLHFSYEEFDYMSDMLAHNFIQQGLRPGMIVANLFVSGNLWSSFLCVDKALEKLGVIQLPIGGLCSNENVLTYLKKFSPDAVMGIPSMLILNAEFAKSQGVELEIPMIFYAGEGLSEIRRDYLEKTWKTKTFASAGYASVDGGVIGYQCSHCGPGEHHLFSDLIDLKIVDGEGVVTSLARESMGIKNYRTGDSIEWINDCSCGSPDRRFKLLGRIDNVVQIWSCRLLLSDVESVMNDHEVLTYQLEIHEVLKDNTVREELVFHYEKSSMSLDQEKLMLALYERSRDVRDTIKYQDFKQNISFQVSEQGKIPRNARTGKISVLKDLRR